MSRPKMLILSFSPIAQDARVLKQVAHFSTRFEVTTCGYGRAPEGVERHFEIDDDLQVWRFSRGALLARQYERAYWANQAVRAARAALNGQEFDVILANDVDAVPLALALAPRCGVHADLHEYAPRQKEEVSRWRWFVAPFMRWMIRKYVTRAGSVTTVSGGIADAFRSDFGIDAVVVTNATPFATLVPIPSVRPLRLVHSGACFRNRELMTMIDAVEATETSVTLDLFLTPNDPEYLRELSVRAETVAGVTVHDPVRYEDLVETLNGFDVGLFVLPPLNFNHEFALPNKLFDFVQARLGVIIGPSIEMARYVQKYRFGVVADDFSVASLASAIDLLTLEAVDEMKGNAEAAAWELSADSQVTLWDSAIEKLLSSRTT